MTELNAELAFRLIEEQGGGGLRSSASHVNVATGAVLFAVDTDGRHLLVPVSAESDVSEDTSSRGVQIRRRLIGPTTNDVTPYLDLACLQPRLAAVFATFVDDVLSQLERRPARPHHVVPAVLERWRQLLRPTSQAGLKPEQVVGVLGELDVLARLAAYDADAALMCWKGWSGNRWDFVGTVNAVEVKATTRPGGRGFWVHGAEQLDTTGGAALVVHARRYRRDDQGTNIPDALGDLSNLGVDEATVRARLTQIGWDPSQPRSTQRYSLTEQWSWRIDEDFPRIVPASFVGGAVPERVGPLRYWIDLETPPPHAIQDADFEDHLATMADQCD